MVINIVLYQGESWILGKFANKLQEHLTILGNDVSISSTVKNNVDINHHIIYTDVEKIGSGVNTAMVTHIDSWYKWKKLQDLQHKVDMLICMSSDTKREIQYSGIYVDKLCYINPAHDKNYSSKKIRLGFFSNIYSDGRKSEKELVDAILAVDNSPFCIVIMGTGWQNIISIFEKNNIQFEWYQSFEKDLYIILIESIDYLIYTGHDEGSMSFLDAIMANKKTIVTSQGFHLDIPFGITHKINTMLELKLTLQNISNEYRNKMNTVLSWTWENYAIKHLELWELLLYNKENTNFQIVTSFEYCDGINSLNVNGIGQLKFISNILFYIKYLKHIYSRIYFKLFL